MSNSRSKMVARFLATTGALALWTAGAGVALGGHDPGYQVVDLGTLGGTESVGNALNNNKQVVGSSTTASGQWRAFRWDSGNMIDLGILDGYAEMFGHGINNLGDAFGQAVAVGGQSSRPFAWLSGQLIDLGTLGGPDGSALAGNNARTVVGYSTLGDGTRRAFKWSQNEMVDLGVLNGDVASCATGINSAGLICGWSEDSQGLRTAVYWDVNGIHSMGVIRGGLFSEAADVNDNGIIVGTSDIGDEVHGFLYENDAMADLGTFPIGGDSRANAVSIIGEVVGQAMLPSIEELQGVVWNTNRVLKNINSLVPPFSDWDTLRIATDINDTAHVTGLGRLRNGDQHGFLLLPKLGLGNPIPGEAGMVNLFDATGATPNARIFLVYGFQWGSAPVPGCPGVVFGMESPRLVGSTPADETGHALYEIFVPNAASRRPILMQVVEDGSCDISIVVVWNFI